MNNYQVLITPLVSVDTYGSEIDVTQDVDVSEFIGAGAIGRIKREVDNGDFDFGVFTFSNIVLRAINSSGRFNDPQDWRTIFRYSRDQAKVTLKFFDADEVSRIVFKGIINDEGSVVSIENESVSLPVLSNDSIIKTVTVSAGAITTGTLYSDAIKQILNTPRVTNVLTYSAGNINPALDLTIDDGSAFDNVLAKTALDELLIASNSIMYVNASNEIIVRDRVPSTSSPKQFYGPGDTQGRENIIQLKSYNTGVHRMFNIVKVNDTASKETDYISTFGARQKDITLDFVTDSTKEAQIAANISNEFKMSKLEFELVTDTETAQGIDIYDPVQVDFQPRLAPADSNKLPVYGQAKYGSVVYPFEDISVLISSANVYKVIGITENPKNFTTTLKLRQVGNGISDGAV